MEAAGIEPAFCSHRLRLPRPVSASQVRRRSHNQATSHAISIADDPVRLPAEWGRNDPVEQRLDVITLAVADLETAIAFYRRLGLESTGVVGRQWADEKTGAKGAIAMFELRGGLLLNLYPRTDLA